MRRYRHHYPLLLMLILILCPASNAGGGQVRLLRPVLADSSAAVQAALESYQSSALSNEKNAQAYKDGLERMRVLLRIDTQSYDTVEQCLNAQTKLAEDSQALLPKQAEWCSSRYPEFSVRRHCINAGGMLIRQISETGFCPTATGSANPATSSSPGAPTFLALPADSVPETPRVQNSQPQESGPAPANTAVTPTRAAANPGTGAVAGTSGTTGTTGPVNAYGYRPGYSEPGQLFDSPKPGRWPAQNTGVQKAAPKPPAASSLTAPGTPAPVSSVPDLSKPAVPSSTAPSISKPTISAPTIPSDFMRDSGNAAATATPPSAGQSGIVPVEPGGPDGPDGPTKPATANEPALATRADGANAPANAAGSANTADTAHTAQTSGTAGINEVEPAPALRLDIPGLGQPGDTPNMSNTPAIQDSQSQQAPQALPGPEASNTQNQPQTNTAGSVPTGGGSLADSQQTTLGMPPNEPTAASHDAPTSASPETPDNPSPVVAPALTAVQPETGQAEQTATSTNPPAAPGEQPAQAQNQAQDAEQQQPTAQAQPRPSKAQDMTRQMADQQNDSTVPRALNLDALAAIGAGNSMAFGAAGNSQAAPNNASGATPGVTQNDAANAAQATSAGRFGAAEFAGGSNASTMPGGAAAQSRPQAANMPASAASGAASATPPIGRVVTSPVISSAPPEPAYMGDEDTEAAKNFNPARTLGIRDESSAPFQRFEGAIPNFTGESPGSRAANAPEQPTAFTVNRGPTAQLAN